MQGIDGKRLLITGASDGIGAELAVQCAAAGARSMMLFGRNYERLETVAARCMAHGSCAVSTRSVDLMDLDAARRATTEAIAELGGLDILVNNAGVSGQARLDAVDDLGWYHSLMQINYFASLHCTHAALPALLKSRGHIVGVSSLAGLVGVPERSAYCASKFAQTGFFDALRVELKDQGVAVTMVYPGVVATQIRQHGFGADGKALGRSGLDESGAMSVAECAAQTLSAIAQRRREWVMTRQGRFGRLLKLIAPEWVDHLALRALAKK